jgi:hypothetical protein
MNLEQSSTLMQSAAQHRMYKTAVAPWRRREVVVLELAEEAAHPRESPGDQLFLACDVLACSSQSLYESLIGRLL